LGGGEDFYRAPARGGTQVVAFALDPPAGMRKKMCVKATKLWLSRRERRQIVCREKRMVSQLASQSWQATFMR
jgi:hypothetical protein